jgi:pyroglutamyl-peptidase
MRALAGRPGVRGGFVHVPLLPEQALERPAPTMPFETLIRAARIILATA